MSEYIDKVIDAWVGELGGEAFFNTVADNTEDEIHKKAWLRLAQLEKTTGARLFELLESKGVEFSAPDDLDPQREFGVTFAKMGLAEAAEGMRTVVEDAVRAYETLLERAPDEDKEVIQFLVDHEVALLHFVNEVSRGSPETALDKADALL